MFHGCCTHPRLYRAWIVCWPFKAVYCDACQEVMDDMNVVLSLLFQHVVVHFWTGMVRVNLGQPLPVPPEWSE